MTWNFDLDLSEFNSNMYENLSYYFSRNHERVSERTNKPTNKQQTRVIAICCYLISHC